MTSSHKGFELIIMDYKAGMFLYALAILLGDVLVQQLRVLPDYSGLAILLVGVCTLSLAIIVINKVCKNDTSNIYFTLIIYLILLFLISFIYSSLYAKQQLSNRLDGQLVGKNLVVTGVISDIPVVNGHVQRFTFNVDDVRMLSSSNQQNTKILSTSHFPRKIRLSWYYGKEVKASEKWQFEVRLKPPHGFMNPAGFDYESWLFQQGIEATGYVRKSAFNRQSHGFSPETFLDSVNRYRQTLAQLIDSLADKRQERLSGSVEDTGGYSLIKALAIGDKSSITNTQWNVLVRTGTSHLMAISGLHIGLAALFGYVLFRRIVPVFVIRRIPAQHVALVAGLFIAFLYALVAGLSITTQRAIIMLFAVSMLMLVRHNHRPFDVLGFALIVILVID
ncbi:MAG: DUF4131 domain-containing protein, partial [Gammaproteobacteria bacterium]|nr:DUF4131 domain-containing protein [Gammaproteobacteria bacterium]